MPPFDALQPRPDAAPARTPQDCHAEILDLSMKLAPVAGRAFLETFSLAAAQICSANHVFVGKLNVYSNMMRTLCRIQDHRVANNFAYSLDGTPCARALENEFCIHPDNVADLYPRDTFLKEMHIAGYVGMALRTQEGRPIGVVVALTQAPFERNALARATFSHFGNRVASEIEALDALDRYAMAADSGAVGLWDWDIQTGDMFIPGSVSRMLGHEGNEHSFDLSLIDRALHDDDREVKKQALAEHMRRGAPFDIIVRLRNKEGVYRWFRLQASAVRDEKGAAVRMIGSVQDVHELVERRNTAC